MNLVLKKITGRNIIHNNLYINNENNEGMNKEDIEKIRKKKVI